MVKKRSYATAANDDDLHRCSGCLKTFNTIKGYRNHLSQSQKCKHATIHLGDISKRGKSTAKGNVENNRKDPPLAEETNKLEIIILRAAATKPHTNPGPNSTHTDYCPTVTISCGN
jgi:hypothetical protein